ncbi:MAG: molecular chaperone DnaJ [Alphaproteobacteria bacterium]|jgi:hypothetical protein
MAFPIVIGAICVAVGAYLVLRWWSQATPQQMIAALRWAAVILGIGVVVFAVLTRRWGLLAILAVPAFALFRAWRVGRTQARNARGPSAGASSDVETRFLRMTLDHQSGAIDGTVVDGEFAGRGLAELTLGELIRLWRACVAEDEASRNVLEAYLDRVHGETWRQAAGGEAADPEDRERRRRDSPWGQGGMSEAEACEILGIKPGAEREAIEAAYRKAMQRAHPDHGGSDWMAARVNQARDVLLGR